MSGFRDKYSVLFFVPFYSSGVRKAAPSAGSRSLEQTKVIVEGFDFWQRETAFRLGLDWLPVVSMSCISNPQSLAVGTTPICLPPYTFQNFVLVLKMKRFGPRLSLPIS